MDEVDGNGSGKMGLSLFPYSRLHPFDKFCRVILEKVEIHDQGDAEQQFAIQ